jgi:hypothetical protein
MIFQGGTIVSKSPFPFLSRLAADLLAAIGALIVVGDYVVRVAFNVGEQPGARSEPAPMEPKLLEAGVESRELAGVAAALDTENPQLKSRGLLRTEAAERRRQVRRKSDLNYAVASKKVDRRSGRNA